MLIIFLANKKRAKHSFFIALGLIFKPLGLISLLPDPVHVPRGCVPCHSTTYDVTTAS